MKAIRKITAILLAAVLSLGLFSAMMPISSAHEAYEYAGDAAELAEALENTAANITINLTDSITYTDSVLINGGRTVTINLEGHTLTMNVTAKTVDGQWRSYGVRLTDGAVMNVNGPGTFNITSPWDAITASGAGSRFNANSNATVNATVNIAGGNSGIGGAYGVNANMGGYVSITGNATVNGPDGRAAYASFGSTVIVDGNAAALGALGIGVYAGNGSKVYIGGSIFGTWADIGIGTGADTLHFSLRSPTRRGVTLSAPFDGHTWDEFTDMESFVYKRSDLDSVTAFVTRLYRTCLSREPDARGLSGWVGLLVRGETDGAGVARGFVFSQEMNNRNVGNEEFVEILYRAFFDRPPDQRGFTYWAGMLNDGWPRHDVFAGFANSQEFANLCNSFGIIRGTYTPPRGGGTWAFVTRLYRECLGREPDRTGLNGWVNLLNSGAYTGTEVARGFVFSREMENKNLDNGAFVDILYRAFLGRGPDANGRAGWLRLMDEGMTRAQVFNGFAGSREFGDICNRYGIRR